VVDVVNRVVSPAPDNKNSPVHVNMHEAVTVNGWFVSGPAVSGKSFDEIYVALNGAALKATVSDRNDVEAHFKNPKIKMSGFKVRIPSFQVHSGLQELILIGVDRDRHKIARLKTSTYILAE
jgi:hypothetical protein